MNTGLSLQINRRRLCASGFGLMELLIALLVFSSGILLVLANQVAGARLTTDSLQRSIATALAADLVNRIQLNPRSANAYLIEGYDDIRMPLDTPGVDCTMAPCESVEFARFELWQWKRMLSGLSPADVDGRVTAFVTPAACVIHRAGVVSVTIAWRSRESIGHSRSYLCSQEGVVWQDEVEHTGGAYQVTMATWVGGEPA